MYLLSYQKKSDGKGTQTFLKLERQYLQDFFTTDRQNMTPLSYQRKSDRESAQTFFKPKDNASFHLQIKPIILPRKFKEENI